MKASPQPREILFEDIEHGAALRHPQWAEMTLAFLAQGDPPPHTPEVPPDHFTPPAPSAEGWDLARLRRTLADIARTPASAAERQSARRAAWDALTATPHPPPRLAVGDLLLELYGADDEPARTLLMGFFGQLPDRALSFGVWRGFKAIYKAAEARHDAAMLGVLIQRLDVWQSPEAGEISRGTWLYMRRRAWRYLRLLGQALPELYVAFAVQVLRHYGPNQSFQGCWVAHQIWNHQSLEGRTDQGGRYGAGPPADLEQRAFPEAWRQDPKPLFELLETAHNDQVCRFAVGAREADFPEALRTVDPPQLRRLGQRGLAATDAFTARLLNQNPDYHPARLESLGLGEMVLGWLTSPSPEARRFAVDYARSHAGDLATPRLVALLLGGLASEVQKWAATTLERRPGPDIGLDALMALLAVRGLDALVRAKLEAFAAADVEPRHFVTAVLANKGAVVEKLFRNQDKTLPAAFYRAVVDEPRCRLHQRQQGLRALGRFSAGDIGLDWLQQALLDPALAPTVSQWLRGGMLRGSGVDVDWLKGLVDRPHLRALALELLGDAELVPPEGLGKDWLLTLLRRDDPPQTAFAQQLLLEAYPPGAFGADNARAVAALVALRTGDEPEALRQFAARYLVAHHPELQASSRETRSAGVTPGLAVADYAPPWVLPLFADPRPDVRRLAAALTRAELERWNEPDLLYRLANHRAREARQLGCDFLAGLGEAGGLPLSPWLQGPKVFQLTESPHKNTRDTALNLIRHHFATIGSPKGLAWLMESPEREVGLFAVRLLWDCHRPPPPGSSAGTTPPLGGDDLVAFLAKTLFGLPPGRLPRREERTGVRTRPLAASVAKGRLIEVVKTLALEERDFAAVAMPLLGTFRRSGAKGEWQACVAALAAVRRAHPDLVVDLGGARPRAGRTGGQGGRPRGA
ncbi:MAG: hypothetical protein ACFCBW_02235, partial [Candidatus Competibacterales bacterium]